MKNSQKVKITDVMLRWEFKFVVAIFLVALSFTQYIQNQDITHELCFWGMAFSALGDLILMNYKDIPSYVFKGKQFYAGAASFTVAHMIYRQMFETLMPENKFFDIGDIIAIVVMIIFFMVVYNLRLKKKSKTFWLAVICYVTVLLAHLASAINCAIAFGGWYILAMIGVICFFVSDLCLFVRETKSDTPLIRKLIWVFYPIAQILIIMCV